MDWHQREEDADLKTGRGETPFLYFWYCTSSGRSIAWMYVLCLELKVVSCALPESVEWGET